MHLKMVIEDQKYEKLMANDTEKRDNANIAYHREVNDRIISAKHHRLKHYESLGDLKPKMNST